MHSVTRTCLTVALAINIGGSAYCATSVLDSFDADQSDWGACGPETTLVKEGQAALRWQLSDGPLARDDLSIDLSRYNSLRLWIYSPRATFARVRMSVPVANSAESFSLVFKVDWQGWNRMELPATRFTGKPADGAGAWDRTQGLTFAQVDPGFTATELVLDGLEQSTDWPQVHVNDHEVLIDWLFRSAEGLDLWKPTGETARLPAGSYGFDPYWCWGWMWVTEDPEKREVCAYTRQFDTDITQYDTLEVRASNDADGFISVHVQIDGNWTTPIAYHKGTGGFEELPVKFPEGARRLDAVTLEISEPPGDIGGSRGRQIKCNVMWLLLREPGTQSGDTPRRAEKLEPAPLNGALEDAGLAGGVYFASDDLPRVRKLFLEGEGKSLWASIQRNADIFLETTPEDHGGTWYPSRTWIAVRPGSDSYALGPAARTCALAYVISGEKKYADFARRALLTAAKLDHWTDGLFARYPLGWGGHGNTFSEASISWDIGLAYDWAYTALSSEERKLVEDALIEKGIWWTYDLLSHNPGILNMNQGVVFDSEIGCALLALEPRRPELADMRKQAEAWIMQGIEAYSLQDGASTEGVGYWHYTWNTAVKLLAAIAQRDPEGLRARCPEKVLRSMDWLVHMKANTSEGYMCVPFCDGLGGAPGASVSAFFAKFLGSPTGAWFQQRYSSPPDELSAFMWEHDTPAETPQMTLARHFRGAGYVFFREGFEYGDTLFSLLGGPPLSGHDQNDRTAFTIEAFGEPLAMDSGMIAYSDPIHTSLGNTRLHNALTIGGADAGRTAKVTEFFSSPLVDYAAVDAAASYPASSAYTRRAIYLRPDHFVISDDMRLKSPAKVEWNLNSAGELSVDGSRVLAKAQGSTLVTDFAIPRSIEMQVEEWPCGYPSLSNNHATITGQDDSSGRFLVSLYPVRKNEEGQVQTMPLAGDGFEGIRISREGCEEWVLERTGDNAIVLEGLSCDAQISVLRLTEGKLSGAAALGGSRLSWQGREIINSSAPGNYSVEYRDDWSVASVQAPVGTIVSLSGATGNPAASALLGAVEGGFSPIELAQTPTGNSFTVPDGDPPLAGYWLIVDKPEWLELDSDGTTPAPEFLVDGELNTSSALAPGIVPETLRMVFRPGGNPLDRSSVRAYFDGQLVSAAQANVEELPDGALAVELPVGSLLKPDDREPRFFTRHHIAATLRDNSLMKRKVSGHFTVSLQPVIKDDVVYLSDLAPVKAFVHGGLIRDRAYTRDRIALAGAEYPKGLTTHPETAAPESYAEIVYDIRPYAGKRNSLKALVGVEEGVPGTVRFYVYTRKADGEWLERLDSGTMSQGSDPVAVDVPLEGADELRLYITDNGDGINSDHAVWAMARLE